MKNIAVSITCAFLVLIASVVAADAQAKIRVRFARGTSSAAVAGSVRGYEYKDYIVGASAGQNMRVRLDRNTKAVFTIFQPGGDNLDMGTETDEYDAALPMSGDYVIRVMMMRSEARRRGSFTNYRLTISVR